MARKIALKEIPVMVFDVAADAEVPAMVVRTNGEGKQERTPEVLRYRGHLIAMLRTCAPDKGFTSDNLVTIEELVAKLLKARNGEELVLEDAEWRLIRDAIKQATPVTSNPAIVEFNKDILEAPTVALEKAAAT